MEGSSQLYSTNPSKSMAETLATSSNSSSNRSRDLLQRFLGSANQSRTRLDDLDEDDDEGLNLGLGLSLGGKFGVDKSQKGLIRSSSIATTMPLFNEGDKVAPPPPAPVHTLVRTASLPVETEEEWRKRKEMQTLRRMEAKRRRSEKQRIMKEGAGSGGGEEKGFEGLNFRGRLKREQQCLGMSGNSKVVRSSSPSSNVENKGRRTTFGSLQGFLMAQSQGSGESQGGNSSGASELESKTHQGSSSTCGEDRSPSSTHSNNQDRGSQDSSSSKHPEPAAIGGDSKRQAVEGGMEDMPCVFTIGSGPNGVRKVEGILYRFGKGEQVRIMCVCHGSFFSPAEFVKHAGGRDVEHPLRHIVVSPSASPFQ